MTNIMQTNGSEYLYRTATDGVTNNNGTSAAVVAPYWVRITRVGDVITGQHSPDGVTWTTQGTAQTVVMTAMPVISVVGAQETVTALPATDPFGVAPWLTLETAAAPYPPSTEPAVQNAHAVAVERVRHTTRRTAISARRFTGRP
jgi:hypothetical protein